VPRAKRSKPDPRSHLIYRGNPGRWYVNLRVAPKLVPYYGADTVRVSLKTSDLAVAAERKWAVIARAKRQLQELREAVEGGQGAAKLRLHDVKAARRFAEAIQDSRDDAERDIAVSLAADYAERMIPREEDEHGREVVLDPLAEERAQRFARLAGLGGNAGANAAVLDPLLDQWLDGSDFTEQTKDMHRAVYRELKGFLKRDPLLVSDVTPQRALDFVDKRLRGRYAKKTQERKVSALVGFWRYLEERLIVPRGSANPFKGHRLTEAASRKSRPDRRPFTDAEIVALLKGPAKASKKWTTLTYLRDLTLLGLYTGARIEDLCGLLVSNVELRKGEALLEVEKGKTDAATRTIAAVHPVVLGVLKRRVAGKKKDAQLFEELAPGGRNEKLSQNATKAFTRYRRACGVADGADFHSFRRVVSTVLESSPVDVIKQQRFLGHEIPTVMHSVYSKGPSREAMVEVARAIRHDKKIEREVQQCTRYNSQERR
jgi:integrase